MSDDARFAASIIIFIFQKDSPTRYTTFASVTITRCGSSRLLLGSVVDIRLSTRLAHYFGWTL